MEIKNDKGEVQEEGKIFESDCCGVNYKPTWREKIKSYFRNWKYKKDQFLLEKALKIIRKQGDYSNIFNKAKLEFEALGYTPLDKTPKDDPNKWIQENVLDLLVLFSTQGHSGSSAPFCINYFNKLARHEPLSPINCTDEEWAGPYFDDETYQNKRLSSVFKQGKDGKPYYLDAIVWRDQDDCLFTGKVNGHTSRQNIKLPFIPKTFYVDVIEDKEKETYKLKDRKQLQEVYEYYERRRK